MGGISINTNSIRSKVKSALGNSATHSRMQTAAAKAAQTGRTQNGAVVHTPEEAAAKFIEVLHQSIESSGITANQAAAISSISAGGAASSGTTYTIGVSWTGDRTRPSLVPERYGGVYDLVGLLDKGWNASGSVYGMWHGHETFNRMSQAAGDFVDSAIGTFMGAYADEYHVKSIESSI